MVFCAAVDIIVLQGLRFHTDAWVVRRAASPFPLGVWLAPLPSRFSPQTCTRSKNKARYPTLMEQFPWLDEYVGRPRGENPSTRRAAAAESREDDRHLLQVNWDARRTICH